MQRFDSILSRNKKISRLYFGEEFCENLIPDLSEVDQSLKYAQAKGLNYTYVCGYLTDKGFNKQRNTLEYLEGRAAKGKKIEIIVNDWGILSLLSQECANLIPVLGRMMVKNSRMPRYTKTPPLTYTELVTNSRLWDQQLEVLRGSNLSVPAYREFLKNHKIGRIELDIVPQGVNLNKNWGFKYSFYTPWSYVTGGRVCFLANSLRSGKSRHVGEGACMRPCRDSFIKFDSQADMLPLVQRGNAIFFDNSTLANSFVKQALFDRVVLENIFL